MTEDQLLGAVLDLAYYERWLTHHDRRSDKALQQGESGFPDVIAARPPRLVVAELKRETEKPTAAQERWLDVYRAVPGVEVHVWRPSDWRSGLIGRVFHGD
jgi:hypothetical protein